MCMECGGWTREEVLHQLQGMIDQHGWCEFGVERGPSTPPFMYTIGLTGLAAHPELLLSGWEAAQARETLEDLAVEVASGRRYRAGEVIEFDTCSHRLQLVRVSDPRRLVMAQELYAGHPRAVAALQVVLSDDDGNFPGGVRRYTGPRQQLFGRLPRAVVEHGARSQPSRTPRRSLKRRP